VRFSALPSAYYLFYLHYFRFIGQNTKSIITLGDKGNVKVIKTDINRRTIDLAFVK